MSVIMTLQAKGDPEALERFAGADQDRMRSIVDQAKQHGVIAHRFYGADDGRIMVVDEWPDAESFQAFFDETLGEIQGMLGDVGISPAGEPEFWRVLESQDKYGWES